MADKEVPVHPTAKQLKLFSPFNKQSEQVLAKIAEKALLRPLRHGEFLFKEGDTETRTFFLVSGEVEMPPAGGSAIAVSSISPQSIKALSNDKPRRATVKAVGRVVVIEMDDEVLNTVAQSIHSSSYKVDDISVAQEDDWMTRFVQYLDALKLPVQNIQYVMSHLQEVPVRKGTVVVRQGDIGDHYYIVKKGVCKVVWQAQPGAKPVELVTLKEGAGFGEEALINDGKRNASIVMVVDGVLMRLDKSVFISQVVEPLLSYVIYRDIEKHLGKDALLVDVREPNEANRSHLQHTVNIPFKMLRKVAPTLDPAKHYVIYLDRENLKVTAFLMTQFGLRVSVLKDSFDDILSMVTNYTSVPGVE